MYRERTYMTVEQGGDSSLVLLVATSTAWLHVEGVSLDYQELAITSIPLRPRISEVEYEASNVVPILDVRVVQFEPP